MCLKGSKDYRQQLAVTTQHRPKDTCWVGEVTAPHNLVACGGDVAAISVQAFWSPPLCSSHIAISSKKVPSCSGTQPMACITCQGPQLTEP